MGLMRSLRDGSQYVYQAADKKLAAALDVGDIEALERTIPRSLERVDLSAAVRAMQPLVEATIEQLVIPEQLASVVKASLADLIRCIEDEQIEEHQ